MRYLGNRSSGRQGIALAEAAAAAGATVHLIAGATDIVPPADNQRITVEKVETTAELQAAVQAKAKNVDALIMAAAVADFRLADYAASKIKKTDDGPSPVITLERNPDILAGTVTRRKQHGNGPAVIVGFAAETGDESTDPFSWPSRSCSAKAVTSWSSTG